MSLFQTDLGIPRTTRVINLPELIPNEKDPVLTVVERVLSRTLRKGRSEDTPGCKGTRLSRVFTSVLHARVVRLAGLTPCLAASPDVLNLRG